jgi:hypothetical protein
MPVVSITRLRVRSWRFMLPFMYYAMRSSQQAKKAHGNLEVSLLRDVNNTFWTCTVWNSEQDMKSFMLAGPHRTAMRKLLEWCDEASLVHWTQGGTQPPDWQEAHRRLKSEGRLSKVNHPSPAQEAFDIPAPKAA